MLHVPWAVQAGILDDTPKQPSAVASGGFDKQQNYREFLHNMLIYFDLRIESTLFSVQAKGRLWLRGFLRLAEAVGIITQKRPKRPIFRLMRAILGEGKKRAKGRKFT